MTAGPGSGRSRKKRPRKRTVEIVGLDHVQIGIPRGEEALARLFYGAVLGLQEVRKQSALSGRGGAWFIAPGLALHLGAEDPFTPARKAHPAFLVADLAKARRRLEAHHVDVIEDESELPIRRCYVNDPFGNRIELIDASDAGFTTTVRAGRTRPATPEG
jgi:catechol 2,3-dioxygenase-like lactoylglutathione lyase family enzyme